MSLYNFEALKLHDLSYSLEKINRLPCKYLLEVEDIGKENWKIICSREHERTGPKHAVGIKKREHIWK